MSDFQIYCLYPRVYVSINVTVGVSFRANTPQYQLMIVSTKYQHPTYLHSHSEYNKITLAILTMNCFKYENYLSNEVKNVLTHKEIKFCEVFNRAISPSELYENKILL